MVLQFHRSFHHNWRGSVEDVCCTYDGLIVGTFNCEVGTDDKEELRAGIKNFYGECEDCLGYLVLGMDGGSDCIASLKANDEGFESDATCGPLIINFSLAI